jgi:DNA-nicking Smr family endonuclease
VLVITGKGTVAPKGMERGVLKREVPLWLGSAEFRRLVIGFEEAASRHGGSGALYVRVRRKR